MKTKQLRFLVYLLGGLLCVAGGVNCAYFLGQSALADRPPGEDVELMLLGFTWILIGVALLLVHQLVLRLEKVERQVKEKKRVERLLKRAKGEETPASILPSESS